MKNYLIVAASLSLVACGTELFPAGTTHANYSRTADSETFSIHDGKDRAGFNATVTKPDGTSLNIQSTDSNGSTAQANAMAAQAEVMGRLTDLLTKLVAVPGIIPRASYQHDPSLPEMLHAVTHDTAYRDSNVQ